MGLAKPKSKKNVREGLLRQERLSKSASPISSCLNDLKQAWQHNNNSIASLWHDWSKIAGDSISSNSRPLSFSRGILIIGANHPQWIQALQYNKAQLLGALRAAGHNVKDLRIQQYFPRSNDAKIEDEQQVWKRHPSRIDVHGLGICQSCKCPAPAGEMKLWKMCGFCRRKELSNPINTSPID